MEVEKKKSIDLLHIVSSVVGWVCVAGSVSSLAVSDWIANAQNRIGLFQSCDVIAGNCSAIPGRYIIRNHKKWRLANCNDSSR